MSSKQLFTLVTLFLLLCFACDECREKNIYVSGENNTSNISDESFQLSQEQVGELIDRVIMLKLGENKTSTIEIMGPPDYEDHFGPKRSDVVEWTCSELIYYMTFDAKRSGLNKSIHLVFDRQEKLIDIYSNMEELNRGDFEPCR